MIPSCVLLGATIRVLPTLADQTVTKHGNGTGTVAASYSINSNGTVTNHNGTVIDTWLQPGGVAANYQVQAVYVSGDSLTAGTLNTWLACTSNRSWSLSATAPETKQTILTVSIRDASLPNTVRTTATITINAENTP